MTTLNTTATIATTTNTAKGVSITDVVVGQTYLHLGKEVKALTVFKKTEKVLVKGKHMSKAEKVSVKSIEEIVMTAEELATQVAAKELGRARKELANAEKALRKLQAQANVVGTSEYVAAVYAKRKAEKDVHQADMLLAAAKYVGRTGRHSVKSLQHTFSLAAIESHLEEQLEDFGDVDKDEARIYSEVYGLISIINLTKLATTVYTLDPESDYTTDLRVSMLNLLKAKTQGTRFSSVWHQVFGGTSEVGGITEAVETIHGIPVKALRNRYTNLMVDWEHKGLVTIDDKNINVIPSKGAQPKRLSLRDAFKKSGFINQVRFIRTKSVAEEVVAENAHLTALQKLVGLHIAGLAFEGLRDHKYFQSVVKIGFKGNTWTTATVVLDPLCVLQPSFATYEKEQLAIAEFLRGYGLGLCSHPENYHKHGYVQSMTTYTRSNVSTFLNEKGESYEGMKQLLVRLNKQVWNEGEVRFDNVKTIAVSLLDPTSKAVTGDMDVEALREMNYELARSLVAGQDVASKSAYAYMGTGRFVTGEEVLSSGQKTVVTSPALTLVKGLEHVYFNVGGGHNEQFIIAGLNSTKSASFRHSDGWVLETFTLGSGAKVGIYVKTTSETYKLTSSATAGQFRAKQVVLTGVDAAVDSLMRAAGGKQSETVTQLIYKKNGKTLCENIRDLLAANLIEWKGNHVTTNSQFNTGLEMQHGVDVAKNVISSLIQNNLSVDFRQTVVNAYELADEQIDSADIGEIDVKSLITTIAKGYAERGLSVEDISSGKVIHANVVRAVLKKLAAPQKPWLRIVFDKDNTTLFPITQDFLESFQASNRPMHVALEGAAAEFFESLTYHVKEAKEVVDMNSGTISYEMAFTPANMAITLEKLSKVRDREAGKNLNRIPAYGATLLLVTSAHLNGNDTFAPKLTRIARAAKSSFRTTVSCLYFKSPILWKGSISVARLVDSVAKDAATAQWLEQFSQGAEEEVLLLGKASMISPEKAVKNGNDADGDLNSFLFVPSIALTGSALANPKFFIDATKPEVSAGAYHYAKKWEEELASLYFNEEKQSMVATKPEATEEQREMYGDQADTMAFAVEFEKAVINAAKEKNNVAFFTASQTVTLNNRGSFIGAFKDALAFVANSSYSEDFGDWANTLLNNEDSCALAAEAFWSFKADAQGALVNLDAMNLVKASDESVKKLASMLSPRSLVKLNAAYVHSKAAEGTSPIATITAVAKARTSTVEDVYKTMFNPAEHNLAIEQLNHVLPVYNTSLETLLVKKLVVLILLICGSQVGADLATKYDVCQLVTKSALKLNGREIPANLETVKSIQEEKGLTNSTIPCVQRTIVELAIKHNMTVQV